MPLTCRRIGRSVERPALLRLLYYFTGPGQHVTSRCVCIGQVHGDISTNESQPFDGTRLNSDWMSVGLCPYLESFSSDGLVCLCPRSWWHSCSLRWQSSQSSDVSYIICLFIFFYFGPLAIIVGCYTFMFKSVHYMTRNAQKIWGANSAATLETVPSFVEDGENWAHYGCRVLLRVDSVRHCVVLRSFRFRRICPNNDGYYPCVVCQDVYYI